MTDREILDLLVSGNYITAADAKRVGESAESRRTSAVDLLLTEGVITSALLGQAVAEHFKVPYADLQRYHPEREQILLIPQGKAVKLQAVVFAVRTNSVQVATANPGRKGLLTELKSLFAPKRVDLAYAPFEEIEPLFVSYRKPLETRFSKIVAAGKRVAPEIFEEIVNDALDFEASDVHLEPQTEKVVVRFRVDGVLREAGLLPRDLYDSLVNHIKVKTQMRIDEHFAAQDGALRYSQDGEPVDLRVSVVPSLDGERVAIRVLSRYVRSLSLSELGLSTEDQKLFLEAAQKPFGMILAVGPTGSGKTTTLYALIRALNKPDINIMTIEDPVEYRVTGINQIQVNPETNLTFAKGLKAIIRQDPNVILVGEIRDEETAEIGVNAALTGHLLFSTFHANDAAAAIPRLLEMGIEPFLLSSTLEFVLAQRLVRKICPTCRYTVADSDSQVEKYLPAGFGKEKRRPRVLYAGKGCSVCGGTGYRGRTAIFELLRVTPGVRELILNKSSSEKIKELSLKEGGHTMFEDGLRKVEQGITTIEEVGRVAPVT